MTQATAPEESDIILLAKIVRRAVSAPGIAEEPGTLDINCGYGSFRVNVRAAENGHEEFVRLLAQFGEVFSDESLKQGVPYLPIEHLVPADKLSVLEIFAFGKAINHWEVVSPRTRLQNPALRSVVFQLKGGEIGSIGIIRL